MNQPAEEALRAWFAAAPPTVFATPASWPVPIETFRRIAADTGFLEGPPHDAATLTFHRPFDHPPGPVDEQRARWLADVYRWHNAEFMVASEATRARQSTNTFTANKTGSSTSCAE